jgi:hypothetical protein
MCGWLIATSGGKISMLRSRFHTAPSVGQYDFLQFGRIYLQCRAAYCDDLTNIGSGKALAQYNLAYHPARSVYQYFHMQPPSGYSLWRF